MGEVIVVTGPPGAGKSTVAEDLARLLHLSAVVAGDDFFGFLRNGALDPWRPEAHEQNTVVLEAAAVATGRFAAHCVVVYDGVLRPGSWRLSWRRQGCSGSTTPCSCHHWRCAFGGSMSVRGTALLTVTSPAHMWQEFRRAQLDPRHVLTDRGHGPVARALSEQLGGGAIRYP